MNPFVGGWARAVIKGRWLVVMLVAVAFGLSFLPMKNLYYDNSNERFFLEGDHNLTAFNHLVDLFGDVEYLSIGIPARSGDADVFNPDTLKMIDELSVFLEDHEVITQVRSLSKYQYTHNAGGMMASDDLFYDLDDPENYGEAREIILQEELALGSLVTEDLQHTRILARTEYVSGTSDHKVKLVHDLNEFIANQNYQAQGFDLQISGQPVFNEQFETLSKNDSAWINPTMALVMIAILFISFRSVSGMLLPWVVIGSGIVLVSGVQGLLGWPHSVVESALVPALIIIGVGVSVHVLVEFYHFRAEGLDPKEAAIATIEHLWTPAFFTAFTTSAGFLALGVTKLVPVQQFAWLGAIGSMTLFLLAVTLLPAVLSFIPWFSRRTKDVVNQGFITRLTQKVPDWTYRLRIPLAFVGGALLLFSLVTIPGIKVDSNFITYFKQDNPTRQSLTYFDDTFTGVQNIDVMIDSGEIDGVKDPQFLQRVEKFQHWLEQQEHIGDANSLVDFLKEIGQAIHFDDPAWYRLPETREMAAQYLFLYDNTGADEDLTDVKDFDHQVLRIVVPVQNMDASETRALLDNIDAQLASEFSDLDVTLTGSLVMYNAQDIYINEGMFQSFLIALLVIGGSFIVLFRSIKYGLIALIPSVVPILVTGSLLVVLDIPLNLGTMIVGAMTMGIAVDDAIHVMNRYLLARKLGSDVKGAITRAMTESGRAVVFTSIVLVTGFSVMLMGSFIPYIYTGLFAASIMALALIGDLIFLPAILYLVDGKKQDQKSNPELATSIN